MEARQMVLSLKFLIDQRAQEKKKRENGGRGGKKLSGVNNYTKKKEKGGGGRLEKEKLSPDINGLTKTRSCQLLTEFPSQIRHQSHRKTANSYQLGRWMLGLLGFWDKHLNLRGPPVERLEYGYPMLLFFCRSLF